MTLISTELTLNSNMSLEIASFRDKNYRRFFTSLLRRGLLIVMGRLGRKKKRARGARWEGEREKRGLCHIMCGSLARFAVL